MVRPFSRSPHSALISAFASSLLLPSVRLLPQPGALAQGAGGTIAGAVTDQTGAVLPGATVTVKNNDTGAARELVTEPKRPLPAPNLPPGPYAVTATLPGFRRCRAQRHPPDRRPRSRRRLRA